jgi:hypothetical protein
LGKIGKAHAELFKDTNPAATMVEVSSLISPELLVDIAAAAIATKPMTRNFSEIFLSEIIFTSSWNEKKNK